jgi:hypothetical protein
LFEDVTNLSLGEDVVWVLNSSGEGVGASASRAEQTASGPSSNGMLFCTCSPSFEKNAGKEIK